MKTNIDSTVRSRERLGAPPSSGGLSSGRPSSLRLLGCVPVPVHGLESPGQFSDYRVENGKYIIDPWVFTDRMGMYRVLLNKTATYFAKFGPENEQNILWGLPLQHGWQYSSGRLADPGRRTNCGYESDPLCISIDSWWADMNYFLSVLPFLAALDSGIMGTSPDQVTLLPPPRDQTRFCYDVSGCRSSFPETIRKWKMFFQYLQTPLSTFEGLLKYSWNAHTASLKDPIKIFEDRFMYYSKEEENLGVNWAITVNYLAASQFPTTLIRAYTFQKGLPPRILNSTDIAPFISNFTELQNIIVVALNIIGDMNRVTGSLTLSIWKILMMTQAARKGFLEFFETVFQSVGEVSTILKLLHFEWYETSTMWLMPRSVTISSSSSPRLDHGYSDHSVPGELN
ncbi:protein LEG1 homolog [Heterocephalus glaber]|uniref:Protein LEG1 homolog n=1 Tax=Heterocephalus glaber TaxID=10181 RepID=A0AAX6P932_HETGA|nr:protein LEG1 homolog [Heterocephalus glaber]